MTAGTNAVKAVAKGELKGNWLKSSISALIPVFCAIILFYLASLIELIAGTILANILFVFMTVFLLLPLFLGCVRFFWRLTFKSDDNPISVFYYFSEKVLYLKSLKLIIKIILKLMPFALLLFLPAFCLWFLSQNYLFELINIPIPLWTGNLSYAVFFLKSLATIILLLYALRYYISPILFVADVNMKVSETLNMSVIISKNTSLDFIFLAFSFIGWILLSFLAIPLVFTAPYFFTAYAVHVKFSITEYNIHIEKMNSKQYPSFSIGE